MSEMGIKKLCLSCLHITFFTLLLFSYQDGKAESTDIIIENPELRLTVSGNGFAQSLIHKPSGQECLVYGEDTTGDRDSAPAL